MIDKLSLPFPIMSDPDRSLIIDPEGLADPNDRRSISRPAMILLAPGGSERWRFVSRDFAERMLNDEVLEQVSGLGLSPTTQAPPEIGPVVASETAMPFDGLALYLKGARFAALTMGLRHKDLGDEIKEDSKAYVAEMDMMLEAIAELSRRRRG